MSADDFAARLKAAAAEIVDNIELSVRDLMLPSTPAESISDPPLQAVADRCPACGWPLRERCAALIEDFPRPS